MSHAWGVEYYVRRLGPFYWQVAKFNEHAQPEEIYSVRYETCTCMVGWNCKHVELVKQWIELGEIPAVFWNENNQWRHEPIRWLA